MTYTLGIDIGGTHTRYGLIGENETRCIEKTPTGEIENFIDYIDALVKKYNNMINVICIGIPGVVNNNEIINLPNLKKLEIRDFAHQLNRRTNKKVIIDKDVNLLLECHIQELGLHDTPNILAFYLGTGLGNAIRLNGQVMRGDHGYAGELGHIPIINNEKICGCGNKGCSETIVSGKALVDIHENHFRSTNFVDIFKIHLNAPQLQSFIQNFANIIDTEINIFDITTIIIGGGVTNMTHFPKELLTEKIKNQLRCDTLVDQLNIHFVNDNPVNGIIGADIIARRGL